MTYDTDHELPPTDCPRCGYTVDRHAGGAEAPKPGDIGLCLRCAAVLTFDDEMRLREGRIEDLPEPERSEVRRLQWVVLATGGRVAS